MIKITMSTEGFHETFQQQKKEKKIKLYLKKKKSRDLLSPHISAGVQGLQLILFQILVLPAYCFYNNSLCRAWETRLLCFHCLCPDSGLSTEIQDVP